MIILVFSSLQAKERTVEEALANSKIFMEKAGVFQEDFEKEGTVVKSKVRSDECQYVASIPFASTLAEYMCTDIVNMNLNDVYCRTANSYHGKLKKTIEKLKASKTKYNCELIYTDDTFDEKKEKKVFSFKGFGTITLDYLDEWKMIDLDMKESM
jgi:hypothetical protein